MTLSLRSRSVAVAASLVLAGCAMEPVWPPPRVPQEGTEIPPQASVPLPPESAAPSPAHLFEPTAPDSVGLGQGPLGRAGVLLDRTIAADDAARSRGEPVDQGMLANLRMTQQARELIARGQGDRAADLLERAIAIDDGAGYADLYLAYIHLTAGRRDQAEVFLARAEASLPSDPALRVELSQLRARVDGAVVHDATIP